MEAFGREPEVRPSRARHSSISCPETASRAISGGKRKLSVSSGAISSEPGLKRTWRSSEHTDWVLILGTKEYRIHKVILATGENASYFLAGAFRKHCGQQECTDLTALIPQRCWQNFEGLLDFMYTGDISLCGDNWASMLKMADSLQIESLYKKCEEVGGELFTKENAPKLAADIVELQVGEDFEKQVVQLAIDVIAPSFMMYETKDLAVLPLKVLQKLLKRNDLDVLNEDVVFNFLLGLGSEIAEPDVAELWKCCRLHCLSRDVCLEAAAVPYLPKEAFVWALAQKVSCDSARPIAPPSWVSDWADGSAPRGRQIAFKVQNPLDYQCRRFLRSPEHQLDDKFKWCLLVFPLGTEGTGAGNNQKQVAAFVELIPEPWVLGPWAFKNVRYEITLVNWKDEVKNITKEHTVTFTNKDVDNGWHSWVTPDVMTHACGWLNERGELAFRARISIRSAVFT